MSESVELPAICDNPECRTTFGSGFWLNGPEAAAVFAGNKSGPCPRCGSWGSALEGWFTFQDLARLAAGSATPEELDIVEAAVGNLGASPTPEQAAEAIGSAGGRWTTLASWFRKLPHGQIAGYGGLLIQIIRTTKGM